MMRAYCLVCMGSVLALALACSSGGQIGTERELRGEDVFRAQSAPLMADSDGDGIADEAPDNCAFVANKDQSDVDNDGYGDVCDPDPNKADRAGRAAPRGEAVIADFVGNIESSQPEPTGENVVTAIQCRICREVNNGPFAKDAKNLKAILTDIPRMEADDLHADDGTADLGDYTSARIYAVAKPDLRKTYHQLSFDLGANKDAFVAAIGGQGNLGSIGTYVRYLDDLNDNNRFDAGEVVIGTLDWEAKSDQYAGVMTSYTGERDHRGFFSSSSSDPTTNPAPGTEIVPPAGDSGDVEDTGTGDSCDEEISSPLVLDLGRDGFAPFSPTNVQFDINGDGVLELVGWTTGLNDAFLALDRNGDGKIDSGKELFGNYTEAGNGQLASTGFEALRALDKNGDGKIDKSDQLFGKLLLWLDRNGDGRSQVDELSPVADYLVNGEHRGIVAIDLSYLIGVEQRDENGNVTKQRSRFTFKARNGVEVEGGTIIDVWFSSASGL